MNIHNYMQKVPSKTPKHTKSKSISSTISKSQILRKCDYLLSNNKQKQTNNRNQQLRLTVHTTHGNVSTNNESDGNQLKNRFRYRFKSHAESSTRTTAHSCIACKLADLQNDKPGVYNKVKAWKPLQKKTLEKKVYRIDDVDMGRNMVFDQI